MYTEEQCWTHMRFAKNDIILLARELAIDGGLGYVRVAGNMFDPIEALVTFLARMSYPNRWEDRIPFLGGRSRSAYTAAFYHVLDFIYNNFLHCITDINRWACLPSS